MTDPYTTDIPELEDDGLLMEEDEGAIPAPDPEPLTPEEMAATYQRMLDRFREPTFRWAENFAICIDAMKAATNFGKTVKSPTLDKMTEIAAAYAMRLTEIEMLQEKPQ